MLRRRISSIGYVDVWQPGHPLARADGYVAEHRWLLHEMAIPVPPGYHVHHRNGDKTDNRWSNLEVVAAGDHHRAHIHAAGEVTNQYGRHRVLPPAERERAAARVAAGEMAADVARELGVNPGVVQSIAREHGLGGLRVARNQFGTWPVKARR